MRSPIRVASPNSVGPPHDRQLIRASPRSPPACAHRHLLASLPTLAARASRQHLPALAARGAARRPPHVRCPCSRTPTPLVGASPSPRARRSLTRLAARHAAPARRRLPALAPV
ncbi:hypothetical protein BS78_02G039100 [Paspalum vaginatum]|nr:hypothetical protein BS78_02G039100 [Paspalum vaginatum]